MPTPSNMNRGAGVPGFVGTNGYSYRPSGSGAAPEFGTASLANRSAQQVGRKPGDPTRIADMLRRRGIYGPTLQMGIMGMQQAFQADQAQQGRDFQAQQGGIDRAFHADQAQKNRNYQSQQNDQQWGRQQQMWGMGQAAQTMRDEKQRGWQLEDQKNQGIDSAFMMPTADGGGAVPMVKDKMGRTSMAGGYMPNKPAALPPPTPGEAAKHISDSLAKGMIATWDGNGWRYDPIKPQKPEDPGSETVTYDASGNVVQKQTRRKLNGQGGGVETAPSTDPAKKPSAFLNSIGG